MVKFNDTPRSCPISILNLPIRIENSLIRGGIESLNKLANINEIKLLKIKQVGPKNIQLINTHIIEYLIAEGENKNIRENGKNIDNSIDLLKNFLSHDKPVVSKKTENTTLNKMEEIKKNYLEDLYSYINGVNFSSRDKYIINNRLRYFSKTRSIYPHSLEEIGQSDLFKVTRERVRQMEVKIQKTIPFGI